MGTVFPPVETTKNRFRTLSRDFGLICAFSALNSPILRHFFPDIFLGRQGSRHFKQIRARNSAEKWRKDQNNGAENV